MDLAPDIDLIAKAAISALETGHSCLNNDRPAEGFATYLTDRALKDGKDRRRAWEMAEWGFGWVIHGMPRVTLTHKLAASLMATAIPSEFCDVVRIPWKYFSITVPSGLLRKDECTVLVRQANVEGSYGARVLVMGQLADEDVFSVASGPWADFAEAAPELPDGHYRAKDVTPLLTCVMRLTFAVCAELQNRDDSQSLRPPATVDGLPRRKHGLPQRWTIALTRPVRCDVRAAVKEFIAGKRGPVTKQSIVRGHWKNQPHGPGGAQRKFIHVEPYWRGPEDAPIAVRPHVLRGSSPAE